MAVRSLHSQLVAQACAHRKRGLQIKRNARNDPELAKISGEVQEFVYARARNEVNSRDFVDAMYARARNALISIVCKGSSAVNVAHTRAQKNSVVHAKSQNAVISRGSTYFVRVCACRNSKCFNFQDLAIFKVLCMQGSIYCYFLDFVHAGARSASLSRAVCTKGFQMLLEVLHFPGILCTQGVHMLQYPIIQGLWHTRTPNAVSRDFVHGRGQDASITGSTKDSNVLISQNFTCIIGAPVGFNRFGSKNGHSGQILIRTWATPLVNKTRIFLQSIFWERTNLNMYKLRLHILFRENIICITFRLDGRTVPAVPVPLSVPGH